MACNVCHQTQCSCKPTTVFVPTTKDVHGFRTVMEEKVVQVPVQVPTVTTVPCKDKYKLVGNTCADDGGCSAEPMLEAPCAAKVMSCDIGCLAGLEEWLFPWLFWVLPAIILISAALGSLGSRDFEYPVYVLANPLRYPKWGFWTALVLSAIFYGVMWGYSQQWCSVNNRDWRFHLLVSIPLWLGLAYIILAYGTDMQKEAAWVAFAMNASLVVVLAMIAGVSPMPEIVILGAFLLAWGLYESMLTTQEAIARG